VACTLNLLARGHDQLTVSDRVALYKACLQEWSDQQTAVSKGDTSEGENYKNAESRYLKTLRYEAQKLATTVWCDN